MTHVVQVQYTVPLHVQDDNDNWIDLYYIKFECDNPNLSESGRVLRYKQDGHECVMRFADSDFVTINPKELLEQENA